METRIALCLLFLSWGGFGYIIAVLMWKVWDLKQEILIMKDDALLQRLNNPPVPTDTELGIG